MLKMIASRDPRADDPYAVIEQFLDQQQRPCLAADSHVCVNHRRRCEPFDLLQPRDECRRSRFTLGKRDHVAQGPCLYAQPLLRCCNRIVLCRHVATVAAVDVTANVRPADRSTRLHCDGCGEAVSSERIGDVYAVVDRANRRSRWRLVLGRANVRRWGTPEERAVFRRAFPLVALGAPDASVGT
jgi:hypothetical protein